MSARPPRGALPHRRRLLRVVVAGWGLAIAIGAAAAGHSAIELLTAEVPVLCGVWLAHSGRAGGRIGAVALSVALVAVATASALIVRDDAVATGIFAVALVLACWLEDRAAAAAAGIAAVAIQALVHPLTLESGSRGGEQLLILMAVVCAAAGPWRYNAERERELVRDRESLGRLVEVSRSVASSDDPRRAVTQGLLEFADADMASLCEVTDDGAFLVVTSSTFDAVQGVSLPTSGRRSGVAEAFASRRSLFIDDTRTHPLIDQQMVAVTGIESILFEPVLVDGEPIGVLTIGWRSKVDAVDAHRRSLLTLAAVEAANAIRRHAAISDLLAQAMTDPLTGAVNRRAFDDRLEDARRRAGDERGSLAIAMLDLNGFKTLNDTQGHAAGDRVLQQCVVLWKAELGPDDVLARLGGDEFAVLLPGRSLQQATQIAAALRAALDTVDLVGTGIGVAQWNGSETAAQLTARADALLYADKAGSGRPSARIDEGQAQATGLLDLPADPELQRLIDAVRRALGTPRAMVSLLTDHTQYVVAQSTGPGTPRAPTSFDAETSLCRVPAGSGKVTAIDDGALVPALAEDLDGRNGGARAYAGAPVIVEGRVFGAVCAIDSQPRTWTGEQILALRMAAEHAALYLAANTGTLSAETRR